MLPNPNYFHFESGQLVYGYYGGANYSAGAIGGTITATSPQPVDLFDWLYYTHDLAYQNSSDPYVRLQADIQLAKGIYDLVF